MEQLKTSPSAKRLNLHYGCIQALYWLIYAVMTAYIVVLLRDRGFSNGEIGYVNAARTCVAVVSQLCLAFFADRRKSVPLKYLISALMAFCLLANLLFHVRTLAFPAVFLLFVVFGATEMSIVSLMDSMAMQYVNAGVGLNYSACRGVGAMTYAAVSLALGGLVDVVGAEFIVPVHGVLIAAYILALLTFPTFRAGTGTEGRAEDEGAQARPASFLSILGGNPRYAIYLVSIVVLFTGYMGIFTFMANVMFDVGGNNAQLGVALFVYSVSQVPMMLFLFPRLKKRVSAPRLVLLSAIAQAVHCLCLYAAAAPWQIILFQGLELFAFGLYIPSSVYFMNEIVMPADRVKGQTLAMTASNLGATLGAGAFGLIIDRAGVDAMLLAGNGLILGGVILMALAFRLPSARASHHSARS